MRVTPNIPNIDAAFLPYFEADSNGLPLLTPTGVEHALSDRYGKVGYVIGVVRANGDVFLNPHEEAEDSGIQDGEIGPPSETVMGRFDDERALQQVENIAHCFGRCFEEEQDVHLHQAPVGARLLVARLAPVTFIDWNMTKDGSRSIKHTFGIAATLEANEPMAEFIASEAKGHEGETYPGEFASQDRIIGALHGDEPVRPAFDLWHEQHVNFSTRRDPRDIQKLVLPREIKTAEQLTDEGWRDLRVANIGGLVLPRA